MTAAESRPTAADRKAERARVQQENRVRLHALKDRAARAGHSLWILQEPTGPAYLASAWGISRRFETIKQVELFVDLVTGAIDARMGRTPSLDLQRASQEACRS